MSTELFVKYHWSGCFEVWSEISGEERPRFRSFGNAFKRFSMYEHSTNFWESKGCAGKNELGKYPKGGSGVR